MSVPERFESGPCRQMAGQILKLWTQSLSSQEVNSMLSGVCCMIASNQMDLRLHSHNLSRFDM